MAAAIPQHLNFGVEPSRLTGQPTALDSEVADFLSGLFDEKPPTKRQRKNSIDVGMLRDDVLK